jgi:hypothetical protein
MPLPRPLLPRDLIARNISDLKSKLLPPLRVVELKSSVMWLLKHAKDVNLAK